MPQQMTHYPHETPVTSSATDESSTTETRLPGDDYSALPEGIRGAISRSEYLWMGDSQKAALIQTETEPEY